jgi:hypothetical protein
MFYAFTLNIHHRFNRLISKKKLKTEALVQICPIEREGGLHANGSKTGQIQSDDSWYRSASYLII